MKNFISLALLTLSSWGFGQDYNINSISEELLVDANAVVRKDEGSFKILSRDKAEYSIHYAFTILNERADNLAQLFMGYDKLSNLNNIEVNVYDASGKRIRKVKSKEIGDRSAYTGNLFDDARIKYIDVKETNYPYTVEFQYTKKYKFLYSIPGWYFVGRDNVSAESSKFTLEFPVEVGARYKEFNFDGDKKEQISEGIKTISWEMNNLPVIEPERYGPPAEETLPSLQFGVSKFDYEGYVGDMSTWDGMAKWQMSLNEGRNDLSQEQIQEIKALTKGLDRIDKIKTVYEYMQQKTRYVSIQLGIGGFQPFLASVVEENGYGDCKALSFYTQSLLDAVGIEAYYSWVYGGSNPPAVDKDFPLDKFNHIILAVPHENDTIWLECTSQTNPFGYLGSFTGDRNALLINDDGGHLVKTTSYPSIGNIRKLNVSVKVNEEGNADVSAETNYTGIMADRMLSRAMLSYDDKKEYLEKSIDIPTFEINDFKIERDQQTATQTVDLWVNKLMSKSGKRLFLQPNVMNKNYFVPLKYKERKTDIIVRHGYHEYDTVNFEFPAGFRIEAAFDPIKIESDFGEYEASIIANEDGKFQYVRHFLQRNGRFDAATYDEYLNFHKEVVRADKRKIALISGT